MCDAYANDFLYRDVDWAFAPGDFTHPVLWWFTIIPANIVNAGLWNVLIPND